MIPRKPVAVLATMVGVAVSSCISACGGPSGAMSQAQAQATYSAIVAPVKASANRMYQAGQDNNIPLLQQEALKAKKDVDAIPGKLQQYDWPSGSAKWDASHIRLIGTKLRVIKQTPGQSARPLLREAPRPRPDLACLALRSPARSTTSLDSCRHSEGTPRPLARKPNPSGGRCDCERIPGRCIPHNADRDPAPLCQIRAQDVTTQAVGTGHGGLGAGLENR